MQRDFAVERRRFGRRQSILFGVLAALAAMLVGLVAEARVSEVERQQANAWYVHTLQVLVLTGKLDASVQGALHAERGYLLTADGGYRRQVEGMARDIARYTARVSLLTRDNVLQRRNVMALAAAERSYLGLLRSTMELTTQGQAKVVVHVVRGEVGDGQLAAVVRSLRSVEAEEERLLVARDAKRRATSRWSRLHAHMLAGAGALFLLFAGACALSAKRAQARFFALTEDLDRFARTDPLTCLPNRRSFDDALAMEIARARRSGADLCLAIFDIDFFKRVNDQHGHPAGDEVLRQVAAVAKRTLRGHDILARIGGEEFAILMPDTVAADGERACDRVRAAIEREGAVLRGAGRLVVTASVGTASLRDEDGEGDLVARADAALYEAKGSGRNVVKFAA